MNNPMKSMNNPMKSMNNPISLAKELDFVFDKNGSMYFLTKDNKAVFESRSHWKKSMGFYSALNTALDTVKKLVAIAT